MAILTMDQQIKITTGTNQGKIWTRDALVQYKFDGPSCVSMPNLQTGHESNRLQPRG